MISTKTFKIKFNSGREKQWNQKMVDISFFITPYKRKYQILKYIEKRVET